MEQIVFEKKIKAGLKLLSDPQKHRFAWLCAVRTLPFLGAEGHFDSYWPQAQRQQHLYALLRLLDISAVYSLGQPTDDDVVKMARKANAAADKAVAATHAASGAHNEHAFAISSVTAIKFTCYNTVHIAGYYGLAATFQEIVLSDLLQLHQPYPHHQGHVEVYGKVWNSFQAALAKEDCAYWGALYQYIFEQGMVLDERALWRRINVPLEVQTQGAAGVAAYLE